MAFINNIHKMINFIDLSRDEFLLRYNYITSLEYDITNDLFWSNPQVYTKRLKHKIDLMCDDSLQQVYTTILNKFVVKNKIKICKQTT